MNDTTMWVESARPQTLDEYVWHDADQRQQVEEWVAAGGPPQHLILSGKSGTGKTSLALLLMKVLNVPAGDIMMIPASRERKIDELEDKIVSFCQIWAMEKMKYIILDEADSMSPVAQRMLRGEMEKYSEDTRFIFTCNYPERIQPAIRSRCLEYHFEALDVESFLIRVEQVLRDNAITYTMDDIGDYVGATYPDLRKCINMVQGGVRQNKLLPYSQENEVARDYLIEMVNLFKKNRFTEARKLIAKNAQVEEYPDIFRYFYRNLELWGSTPEKQDDALLIIRRAVVHHSTVINPEINLSACIVELSRLQDSADS